MYFCMSVLSIFSQSWQILKQKNWPKEQHNIAHTTAQDIPNNDKISPNTIKNLTKSKAQFLALKKKKKKHKIIFVLILFCNF